MNNIKVISSEFENPGNTYFEPIEIATGRINGKLWVAESYFPSRNAVRAWRVKNVSTGEAIAIARAINKFENEKERA